MTMLQVPDRLRALDLSDRRIAIALLVALALVMAAPLFLSAGVYPSGIDTPAHLFKIEVLRGMMADHGAIFPWTDAWYGGYPILTIYPPLSYYALLVLRAVTADTVLAYNIFRYLILAGFGVLVFLIADREFEDRTISAAVGFLAITSYPFYNNLFTVGRIAFAAGILLYLFIVYLLLDPEIYTSEINRRHLLLVLAVTLLVWTHSMMAYILVYTGVFAAVIYAERLRDLGIRPVIVVAATATVLVMPYVSTFLQHSSILDPFWIIWPVPPEPTLHLYRRFGDFLPHYLGMVHAGLLIVGIVLWFYERTRFATFCLVNFLFFYVLFWSYNLGLLHLLPLGHQFDLSRFELLFAVYGLFIAGMGLRELVDTLPARRTVVVAVILLPVLVDVAPMVASSQNWTPGFAGEMEEIEVDTNESYRAISVATRHWDDYFVPAEMGVGNTFGWFMQADPHYNFTRTLQRTGGLWYPTDKDFPTRRSQILRKNLMQLSNTKYLVFGRDWVPSSARRFVLGQYATDHGYNLRMRKNIGNDPEFDAVYTSDAMEVYALDREMSFCEAVRPVEITRNYYRNAVELLSYPDILPAVPVRGTVGSRPASTSVPVDCTVREPGRVSITAEGAAWVLVKESYYPFWERANGKQVHEAFGFMVTHVNGTGDLRFDEGDGGLRS